MAACQGGDAVYTELPVCLGVCAKLREGSTHEPGGNTVFCRDTQAKAAALGETQTFCPNAGPGGGTECGPDCESYCMLYATTCADDFPPLDNCLSACATLRRSLQFNSVSDYHGDSLDCRLVHVSVATTDHADHCPHARIVPPTEPCSDDSEKAPSCEDYCQRALGACGVGDMDGGDRAQYDSLPQCMDVCRALPPGKNNQQDGNTVGCRLYHSYNALAAPATHCAHTGPTGDGHCAKAATMMDRGTDNCDPYCQILKASCSTQFKETFGTDDAAHELCHTDCAKLDGVKADSGYTVHPPPEGPTVQCRVLHAARAFEKPDECDAAFGKVTCK
jgi:hypothetical protein